MSRPIRSELPVDFYGKVFLDDYSFVSDAKIFDSRLEVVKSGCLIRRSNPEILALKSAKVLSADYPLISPSAAIVDGARDTEYRRKLDLLVQELEHIEKVFDINGLNESDADKKTKITLGADGCFRAVLASLQDEIGEFVVEPDGGESWETSLQKMIIMQYGPSVEKGNYRAFNEFITVLFGATYYGTHDAGGELQDKKKREDVFQKIKSAADLKNCVGGASGAMFNLFQNFSTELTFWTAGIKQLLVLQLSNVCADGNIVHLDSWLEHLLTGTPGPDKMGYFAAMDMSMEDVRMVLMELSYNRADLIIEYSAKEVIRIAEEVKIATIAELKKKIAPKEQENDQDYWNRVKDDSEMEDAFNILLMGRFDEIKINLVHRVLPEKALEIVKESYVEEDVEKFVAKTANLQTVNIPQSLVAAANILLICNSYLAKQKSIPLWLRQAAATKFFDNRKYPISLQEISDFEADIVKVLESAADALQAQGVFIKLIKIEDGHETKVSFARGDFEFDREGINIVNLLQKNINDGAEIECIQHLFTILNYDKLALPVSINIDGLFFHPQQQRIIHLFNQNKINLEPSCFERAVHAGDYDFITIFAKELAKHVDNEWRLAKVPQFSMQKLELLSMALSRSALGVEGAQKVMGLLVERSGAESKVSVSHQLINFVREGSDKILAIMIFRKIVGDEEFIRVLSNIHFLNKIVRALATKMPMESNAIGKERVRDRLIKFTKITADVYDNIALTQNSYLKRKSALINHKISIYFKKDADIESLLLEKSYRHNNDAKIQKMISLTRGDFTNASKNIEVFGLCKELKKEGFVTLWNEKFALELLKYDIGVKKDVARMIYHQKNLLELCKVDSNKEGIPVNIDREELSLKNMLQSLYSLPQEDDGQSSLMIFLLKGVIEDKPLMAIVSDELLKHYFCRWEGQENIIPLEIVRQITVAVIEKFQKTLIQKFLPEDARDMIRDLLRIKIKTDEGRSSLFQKVVGVDKNISESLTALKNLLGIDNLLEIFHEVYLPEIASNNKAIPGFITYFPLSELTSFLVTLCNSADDGQKIFMSKICFELSNIFVEADLMGSDDLIELLKIGAIENVPASQNLARLLMDKKLYAEALPYLLEEVRIFPLAYNTIDNYAALLKKVAECYLSTDKLVEAESFYGRIEEAYQERKNLLIKEIAHITNEPNLGPAEKLKIAIDNLALVNEHIAKNDLAIRNIKTNQKKSERKRKADSETSFQPLLPVNIGLVVGHSDPKLQPQVMEVTTLATDKALHRGD